MPQVSAYLFLEISILVFIIGFCWEYWRPRELVSRSFWRPALGLAAFWLTIDQAALALGIWAFPLGGSLRLRVLALPIEEWVLFFLHTVICSLLVSQYWRPDE